MAQPEVVICGPVRTPIGSFNGHLKTVPATELGSHVVKATIARSGIDPSSIASVVMGNVVQAGNRMNPARQAAINGGVAVSVPALTVNRVCGSGAQAVVSAAREILLGETDFVIAGGMENMDRAPYLMDGGRWGYRMGPAEIYDSMLRDGLDDAFSGRHSGWHTEDLVAEKGISRSEQDEWAARSQQRFHLAASTGNFEREIVPVSVSGKKGDVVVDIDEPPRPETTVETLARLKPAFKEGGTITAGNSPGLNSGAAAMIVAERRAAEAAGLRPMARIASYGIAAVEPAKFALGPVPATLQALGRAKWSIDDLQRVEINEAYAAVPIIVCRELGLRESIVNVEGGAVAHGHPIGATGAILIVRLLHSMARDGLKRGLVTLCVGGGQGIAITLEMI